MNLKITFPSVIMLALSLHAQSRTTWNIDNSLFTVDTLYHATVGPGTTETELRVEGISGNTSLINNLFYITVDLHNPYVEMRAAKAGNTMRAVETVPEISDRFTKQGEEYFAGVNSDFFNTSYPYNALGATISNGSLANFTTPPAQADIDSYYIYFDSYGEPSLSRHVTPAQDGSVSYPDGSGYIHSVNKARGENQLILYTPQWQYNTNGQPGHTGTNQYGAEIALRPVEGATMWGDMQSLEVISAPERGIGNMKIPEDGYVLSAHGLAIDQIMNLKKGDIVKSFIGISADGRQARIKELIAGFPFILIEGMVQPTPGYPEHLANREPRTAVGFNHDKSRLIMLVVDGRKAGGSAGVTQNMLAQFMYRLGCAQAMNFDGGGSSTMYIRPLGVRNVPSSSSLDPNRKEGEPRVVVNALFAVSKAPADNSITAIEIREKRLDLATGQTFTPTVYGYNQYGTLVDTDVHGFTCCIAPEIATTSGSTITGMPGNYRGDLTVTYGCASYSIPVFLNGGNGEYVNSSVDDIEADTDLNLPAVYYTPLGQLITSPTPGSLVIERRGSHVTKRIIR